MGPDCRGELFFRFRWDVGRKTNPESAEKTIPGVFLKLKIGFPIFSIGYNRLKTTHPPAYGANH